MKRDLVVIDEDAHPLIAGSVHNDTVPPRPFEGYREPTPGQAVADESGQGRLGCHAVFSPHRHGCPSKQTAGYADWIAGRKRVTAHFDVLPAEPAGHGHTADVGFVPSLRLGFDPRLARGQIKVKDFSTIPMHCLASCGYGHQYDSITVAGTIVHLIRLNHAFRIEIEDVGGV